MADPIDYSDLDLQLTVRTVYGEARGEGLSGQQAVAWVIRNRAAYRPPAWWGAHPGDVCIKPKQFSCWNRDDPNCHVIVNLGEDSNAYRLLAGLVKDVFTGKTEDPTKGATHYERVGAGASWAKGKPILTIIGNHAFYKLEPNE